MHSSVRRKGFGSSESSQVGVELDLIHVIFELDCKVVVDKMSGSLVDLS